MVKRSFEVPCRGRMAEERKEDLHGVLGRD